MRNILRRVGPGVFGDKGVNFLWSRLLAELQEFRALDFDFVGEASGHENEGAKAFVDAADDATRRRATTVAHIRNALGINERRGEDRRRGGHRQPSERDPRSAWRKAGPCRERILGARAGNRSEETRHRREQGPPLRPRIPCDCGTPNSANTNGPKLCRQMALCPAAKQDRPARDRLWGWRR